MKKVAFAVFFILATNLALASNTVITIHESVVNGLLDTVGRVCKDIAVADVCIKDPQISINGDGSGFSAVAVVSNVLGKLNYHVYGNIKISPDLANDKIKVKVYNVIIRDCMFGNKCNVSDWYDPSFDLPIQLPKTTDVLDKKINIKQSNFQVVMGANQMEIRSDVGFSLAQ
jgi:hypothetical protein